MLGQSGSKKLIKIINLRLNVHHTQLRLVPLFVLWWIVNLDRIIGIKLRLK